jgi:hypothetical protein
MLWANKFARSKSTNKTTKSLWRRLWARACRLRAPHKRNDREFISGARFKMILLTN